MSKRVLIFFPHNPVPPRCGAHQRCWEMIEAFRELGCSVSLCGTTLLREHYWDESGGQSAAWRDVDLHVHRRTLADYAVAGPIYAAHRLLGRNLAVNSRAYCPPGLSRFFERLVERVDPDVLVMNYAFWDRLIDHRRYADKLRLIDTLDLVILNFHMQQALRRLLPRRPLQLDAVPDEVLDEDFFAKLPPVDSTREFKIFDKYDYTLSISGSEAELIRSHTSHTRAVHVPMTQQPRLLDNTYSGPALLPVGDNVFNVQGYAYFVKKVLPRVVKAIGDFQLQVTGSCCPWLCPAAGVTLDGYLPDLEAAYAAARFVVCPTFGGTGQQVKIVEAMSRGLPVVALAACARASPLVHGVNGLVVQDAGEFAEAVWQLWLDRDLCRRLGAAARDTVAEKYSRQHLIDRLSQIVNREA
jgi:glycosyltransferase involved in cell wall biosynthesis